MVVARGREKTGNEPLNVFWRVLNSASTVGKLSLAPADTRSISSLVNLRRFLNSSFELFINISTTTSRIVPLLSEVLVSPKKRLTRGLGG